MKKGNIKGCCDKKRRNFKFSPYPAILPNCVQFYILSMKLFTFSHVHASLRIPYISEGLLLMFPFLIYIPLTFSPNSLAHFISQIAPSAFLVFSEIKTIIASQLLILVLQFVFQLESQGFFTDISTNSYGILVFFA